MQVTFWDLRCEWLELLYRHHVSSARLGSLLSRLNSSMSELCKGMAPGGGLQPQLARALLRASVQVCVWGGGRWGGGAG